MKIKAITLGFFAFILLSACNSNAKKEPKPAVDTDSTSVKAPEKPVVEEQPYVYGIDISSYQGDEVEDINAHKDTIKFVIAKATQGDVIVDTDFATNWPQIKKDGFIRGAYHFYVSSNNTQAQAKLFSQTVGSLDSTDLPPVVDFESGGIDPSESVEEVQAGLMQFITLVQRELGRKPMIYTDIPTANKYLDQKFSQYALWIADYNGESQPDLPTIWQDKGWTFWQRTDDYKLDNFTDDGDVFNGDITKLEKFILSY
jgi:lysozyme